MEIEWELSLMTDNFFLVKEELLYPSLLFLPFAPILKEAEPAKWDEEKEDKHKVEKKKS